jgi:hypothetical protein
VSNISSIEGEEKESVISCEEDKGIEMKMEKNKIERCSLSLCNAISIPPSLSSSSSSPVINGVEGTKYGHGGFIFVDSIFQNKESPVVLNFLIKNDFFRDNKASYGRDIYIRCFSLNSEVNGKNFGINFESIEFEKENSMIGEEWNSGEKNIVDLIPCVNVYYSLTIYVSKKEENGGKDDTKCGNFTFPCTSLSYGFSHLRVNEGEEGSMLIIMGSTNGRGKMMMKNMKMKGKGKGKEEKGRIEYSGELGEKTEKEKESLIDVEGEVNVEKIQFIFKSINSNGYSSLFGIKGELIMRDCEIRGEKEEEERISIDFFLLSLFDEGKVLMDGVKMMNIHVEKGIMNQTSFNGWSFIGEHLSFVSISLFFSLFSLFQH